MKGGESMFEVREPDEEEIREVLEALESGFELDDRELWIWRNCAGREE